MKCFRHPVSDAIGLCKYCCKGMCSECAKDTSFGVVCSPPCEQEVRTIREIVERNRKIPPAQPRGISGAP
jgi:hypothetical protein